MATGFSANKSTDVAEAVFQSSVHSQLEGYGLRRNYGQIFGDERYLHYIPDEIAKGPYEICQYLDVLKEGSIVDRSVRVHVVGNFAQGKTSLVKRLLKEKVKKVQSTDGIEVLRLRSHGLQLLPDIRKQPKLEADKNAFSIEQMFDDKETPIEYDIWDFGGQYVFYATHSLFHSKRAIYLLVMDLSKDMSTIIRDKKCPNETGSKNMEYFIRFWMNSLHSFAGSLDGNEPPVILVGTHFDKIRGFFKRTKLKHAERYFENVRRLFDGTQVLNHIQEKDFAVNNHKRYDVAIDLLKEEIMRIGGSIARAVEIPVMWIELENELKNIQKKVVTLDDVRDTVFQNHLPEMSVDDIKLFLEYQHAKGTLFYFDRYPVADYIVLDPQYLIDAFKCIVTSERFCQKVPRIRPLWKKLTAEGKLDVRLIDSLWTTENGFLNHKEVLLGYLKQHHIISEAMQYDDHMEKAVGLGWYVVPSLLKDHSSQSEISEYLWGKVQVQVRFLMNFEYSSVVALLFHRLIAATLGRWSIASFQGESLMYENLTIFRLNIDHDGIVEMKDNLIELTAVNLCPSGSIDSAVVDGFRRFVEKVVLHEFAALKGSLEEKRVIYTSYYRCNNIFHGINGSKQIQEMSQLSTKTNSSIPCPDGMPHEIDRCCANSEWFQEDKVPTDVPKKDISDKQFSRIANAIGLNWRFLGLELGLTDVKIDHVVEGNPHSVVMQIYKMLLMWRQQMPLEAKMDTFTTVLQKCSNVRIDWDAIRNIIDDMKAEHSAP